jgi:GDPmannose 4,6-dehydratase
MKIIITGVSGQVGSYMAEYCLNLGHVVYAVVRRISTPNNVNFKHLIEHPNFKLVTADLTDGSSLQTIVENILPDYFINLAAQSFVGVSWQIPEETFNVDTLGVIRCLEAIRKNVPHCRFYNAGSSEQFGNVDYSPQDEKHPFKPRSPYGAAKCSAHHIIKVYRESYNLYAVQGLLFNHESERRGEEFVTRKITLGVARISNAILKGELAIKPIELGNLDAKRDWSHAEDFVDAIWRMLNQEKYNENLKTTCDLSHNIKDYVVSSGETHSIREFVEAAFKAAGISGQWDFINGLSTENETFMVEIPQQHCLLEAVKINKSFYRPAEVDVLMGNSKLIRKELGWAPKIHFSDLISRMVKNDILNINTN